MVTIWVLRLLLCTYLHSYPGLLRFFWQFLAISSIPNPIWWLKILLVLVMIIYLDLFTCSFLSWHILQHLILFSAILLAFAIFQFYLWSDIWNRKWIARLHGRTWNSDCGLSILFMRIFMLFYPSKFQSSKWRFRLLTVPILAAYFNFSHRISY